MLNASPGPMPGAPFQSPMVSAVMPRPLPLVVLGGARFTRLNRLNISIRNWVLMRSVLFVFLMTEKLTNA